MAGSAHKAVTVAARTKNLHMVASVGQNRRAPRRPNLKRQEYSGVACERGWPGLVGPGGLCHLTHSPAWCYRCAESPRPRTRWLLQEPRAGRDGTLARPVARRGADHLEYVA